VMYPVNAVVGGGCIRRYKYPAASAKSSTPAHQVRAKSVDVGRFRLRVISPSG
jgi:hypothetical protein